MNISNNITQSDRTSTSINAHIARMTFRHPARRNQTNRQPVRPLLNENEELLEAVPAFNKDIVSLILSYRITEPIHEVLFHCSWCDTNILKNTVFNPSNPYEWELPCHPFEWGSNRVNATYTIETEYAISIENHTGHYDTSDDW
jgi:hypothetical protein